ncbi:hypothetical protein K490DRAFT_58870 [Saccharata proteae CBS 121410]|uniref:Ubiquitin-like domain-containing protein n=1 Tax=Saccharata proteae CBS 121410 TaxID=1314787 RepID=A0A9P4LXR7_9PEZI|nr:hypothetical protein K490DRAFT_58870 [Saccharata proteae CBS 121410]
MSGHRSVQFAREDTSDSADAEQDTQQHPMERAAVAVTVTLPFLAFMRVPKTCYAPGYLYFEERLEAEPESNMEIGLSSPRKAAHTTPAAANCTLDANIPSSLIEMQVSSDPPSPSESPDPPPDEPIATVVIQDEKKFNTTFCLPHKTPLQTIFLQFSALTHNDHLEFFHKGLLIDEHDSFLSMSMSDGDLIEAHEKQVGNCPPLGVTHLSYVFSDGNDKDVNLDLKFEPDIGNHIEITNQGIEYSRLNPHFNQDAWGFVVNIGLGLRDDGGRMRDINLQLIMGHVKVLANADDFAKTGPEIPRSNPAIVLSVRGLGQLARIAMMRTEPLEKVMEYCAKHMGANWERHHLMVKGRKISAEDTPNSLGLKHDSTIRLEAKYLDIEDPAALTFRLRDQNDVGAAIQFHVSPYNGKYPWGSGYQTTLSEAPRDVHEARMQRRLIKISLLETDSKKQKDFIARLDNSRSEFRFEGRGEVPDLLKWPRRQYINLIDFLRLDNTRPEINIGVRWGGNADDVMWFYTTPTTVLQPIMKIYAGGIDVDPGDLRFFFKGQRVGLFSTPASIGMNNRNVLYVMVEGDGWVPEDLSTTKDRELASRSSSKMPKYAKASEGLLSWINGLE